MCDYKETYFGKTVSRINQHISDGRTGICTCKFPMHVNHCAMESIMMKLKDSQQLEFFENHFHKNDMILFTVQSI